MLALHFTRIGGSTQTEEILLPNDIRRKLDTGDDESRRVHPRGDEKYAQSSEGTGDSGVTWRRRQVLRSRTKKLVILNRGFVGIPPSPRFFISVHSKGS